LVTADTRWLLAALRKRSNMNEKLLKREERAVFALRELYSAHGYSYYKMSKFEEYDLYVENKDFLVSDGIISFTDGGKLMALKPDVTLSIIKGVNRGESKKLYYNENVYRRSKETGAFKELMQVGLECVGEVTAFDQIEVISLAVDSLKLLGGSYALDLSHLALIEAAFDSLGLSSQQRERATDYIASKNLHDLKNMLVGFGEEAARGLIGLLACSGPLPEAVEKLSLLNLSGKASEAVSELKLISECLTAMGKIEGVNLDFSVTSSTGYYSGTVFKGFILGSSQSVLSGGCYDRLMKKTHGDGKAIGFAVYLDLIGSGYDKIAPETQVALIGKGVDALTLVKFAAQLRERYASVEVVDRIQAKYDKVYRIENGGLIEND